MSSIDASLPSACTAFRADLISSRRRSSRWDCQREARPSTAALMAAGNAGAPGPPAARPLSAGGCPAGSDWRMFTIPSVSGTLGISNRFDQRRQHMPDHGTPATGPKDTAAPAAGSAVAPELRKAVVVGGNRIPFARTGGAYTKSSNQDMLTAALDGLIAWFGLQDERIGEVAAGAVLKH